MTRAKPTESDNTFQNRTPGRVAFDLTGQSDMARRFRFNLEAVLRYRTIMEDERRREYLEAKRLVDEEKVKRQEMDAERNRMQDEIVAAFEKQAPIQSVMTSYHIIGRIEQAMVESLKREQQLEVEVEKRRQAMIHARQETRMMETLKERRKEEFVKEQDRVEQAFMDELSIQSQGRRVREARAAADLEEERKRMAGFREEEEEEGEGR